MANKNEQIALKLGWERFYPHWGHSQYGWHAPQPYRNATCWYLKVPDFEREWEHAEPLLEELLAAGFEIEILLFEGEVHCSLSTRPYLDREEGPAGSGDTLTGAIACAWLAWKKEGK